MSTLLNREKVAALSEYFSSFHSQNAHRQIYPVNAVDVGLFTTEHGHHRSSADNDDGVANLCLDTLLSGFAALVFCPTKQWCEQLAESMAKQVGA